MIVDFITNENFTKITIMNKLMSIIYNATFTFLLPNQIHKAIICLITYFF